MEEIAEAIDTLENLIAALQLPMPPATHLSALRQALPELHGQLKHAYLSAGGEDVWA